MTNSKLISIFAFYRKKLFSSLITPDTVLILKIHYILEALLKETMEKISSQEVSQISIQSLSLVQI